MVANTSRTGDTNPQAVAAAAATALAAAREHGNGMSTTTTTMTITSAKPRKSGGANDGRITILLVDDDADCRMLIRDAIAECKVSNSVYEVANGQEALDFLHRRGTFADAPRPGLIYLDIEMPGMDGQATLRAIKSSPHLRDIPVVMMTGVCDEQQMKLAAENGANSYTLKPANAEQFLRTVLASTSYWLTIHQYPEHHVPPDACRR